MSTVPGAPPARGGHALMVKPQTGNPAPGSAGWKAFTANRWAKSHPYAGQANVDPVTGQPKMPSNSELLAKAHSQTWKAIQSMIAALPSQQFTDQPFDAQRAAIAPIVDAHRDWLLKAGDYQTRMVNGLAQLVQDSSKAADTAQVGNAAAAGAPVGTAPTTNVTPAETAVPALAEGGSTASYLQGLVPFATAQGIGNVGKVNAAQDTADATRREAVRQIASQGGDLEAKNFTALTNSAFDVLKGQYAALAAGQKNGATAAKLQETTRVDTARIAALAKNADTAALRAQNAVTLHDKTTNTQTSAAVRSTLQKGLVAASKAYNATVPTTPGKQGGGKQYGVTVTLEAPRPLVGSAAKGHTFTFYGNSIQEANAKALHFKATHPADTSDPTNPGFWNTAQAKTYTTSSTGSAGKTQLPEPQRRADAWRQLVAFNSTLGPNAYTTAALRNLFRGEFGLPK